MCLSSSRIIDPAGFLTNEKTAGIADPLGVTKTKWGDPTGRFAKMYKEQDNKIASAEEQAKRRRLAAAAGAYDRPQTLASPGSPNRTILGGFGG